MHWKDILRFYTVCPKARKAGLICRTSIMLQLPIKRLQKSCHKLHSKQQNYKDDITNQHVDIQSEWFRISNNITLS